jgi:hypothetical protein
MSESGLRGNFVSEQDFEALMTGHWLRFNIGPREAAAKLQPACGNVEPLDEATLLKLETNWQQQRNAFHIALAILGGPWNRLAGFDCEDVESPADHTHIVHCLAAATDDKLVAEDVVQTTEPNDNLRLTFKCRGNSYSFTFEGNGSWVNLPGTLGGLNHILEQLGAQERFIELHCAGAGPGIVAFVLPGVFLPAARELHIRLESTPNVKYA